MELANLHSRILAEGKMNAELLTVATADFRRWAGNLPPLETQPISQPLDLSDLPALPVYDLANRLAEETGNPLVAWLHAPYGGSGQN